MGRLKILLPFFDDTTLMSAVLLKKHLFSQGTDGVISQVLTKQSEISERQVKNLLEDSTFEKISKDKYFSPDFLTQYDAVISSRLPWMNHVGQYYPWKSKKPRPAFVSHYPGLVFDSHRAFINRQNNDALFFNTKEEVLEFKTQNSQQFLGVGNPYFVKTSTPVTKEGICFLAQAISPESFAGRQQILEGLLELAKANPTMPVTLKLRHKAEENTKHIHAEKYSYEALVEDLPSLPPNFSISTSSMSVALSDHHLFLSCSSSGLIEALAHGKSGFFITDYHHDEKDYFHDKIKKMFSHLGLTITLKNLPKVLETPSPDSSQVPMICSDDYLKEFLEWLSNFRSHQVSSGSVPMMKYKFSSPIKRLKFHIKKLIGFFE